jgi:uncharacterized membrane protein
MTMKPATVLLAASGWIALAATALPAASPARIAISLAFVLICPGAAVIRIVAAATPKAARYEPMLNAALGVAVSVALVTLVSEGFFLVGNFSMTHCVVALAALTSLLAFVPGLVKRRLRDGEVR